MTDKTVTQRKTAEENQFVLIPWTNHIGKRIVLHNIKAN